MTDGSVSAWARLASREPEATGVRNQPGAAMPSFLPTPVRMPRPGGTLGFVKRYQWEYGFLSDGDGQGRRLPRVLGPGD